MRTVKPWFRPHVPISRGCHGCLKKSRTVVPKPMYGNKISNFKTFFSTGYTGLSPERSCLRDLNCVTFKISNFFFLKTMELGKNATDKPYSSSKQPFWLANMKIHLILVYWDARNSLSYNLVIPFKDGVTFIVTTATQSLHDAIWKVWQI